jgi:hypothetical protein
MSWYRVLGNSSFCKRHPSSLFMSFTRWSDSVTPLVLQDRVGRSMKHLQRLVHSLKSKIMMGSSESYLA